MTIWAKSKGGGGDIKGMLSGSHEVKSHSATVPFLQQELADPRVHVVLNSYDVAGGRHTLIVAYNTTKWRTDNPKTFT